MKRWALWAVFGALLAGGCAARTQWADAVEVRSPSSRRIDIAAGRHGFSPTEIAARAGEVVTLVFTRSEATTCVDRVRVYLDDRRTIERTLPLSEPVSITLRLPHAGEVGISCAMQMFGATVRVME